MADDNNPPERDVKVLYIFWIYQIVQFWLWQAFWFVGAYPLWQKNNQNQNILLVSGDTSVRFIHLMSE